MPEDRSSAPKLLGKEEKAKEIIDNTKKEVAAIRMKTENLPKKRVFIQLGIKPLHAVTRESFLNDYIEFGGDQPGFPPGGDGQK